jgi:hypothetical protein
MSSEKITEDITTTTPAKDAPALVKKIGRTTYIVRVHFSKASKETMSDKIKRMLKNKIWQM